MLSSLRSFLHFARRQRYQLGFLALVLSLLLLAWHFLPTWIAPPRPSPARQRAAEAAWQALQQRKSQAFKPFDPNGTSQAYLRSTGLDSGVAARWMAYLSAGGRFHKPADLLKIYGMDSLWWQRARPCLRISLAVPQTQPPARNAQAAPPERSLRPFYLNEISRDSLIAMGLNPFQASRILAFRERYRPFRRAGELFRVYGLDSALARRLLPYARVAVSTDSGRPAAKSDTARPEKSPTRINVNTADSLALLRVKGIGPFTAGQILKRRRIWGGLHSLSQLIGVYPIDSSRFAKLRTQLFCRGPFRRYDLNKVPYDTLIRWPALQHRQVEAILSFRQRIRPYRSVRELLNIALIDTVLFRKIAPYLYVDTPQAP